MKLRSRPPVVLGLLAAASVATVTALIIGLTGGGSFASLAAFVLVGAADPTGTAGPAHPGQEPAAGPTSGARTSFPGLAAAKGEPELASIRAARPRSGQILRARGPFDDRFVLEGTTFDGSAVSGAVLVTSDVSDLLELQVLAGFHDSQGNLLGTSRFVHHLGAEGHSHAGVPEERTEFRIPVPAALKDRAASVSIGVPVLVNE